MKHAIWILLSILPCAVSPGVGIQPLKKESSKLQSNASENNVGAAHESSIQFGNNDGSGFRLGIQMNHKESGLSLKSDDSEKDKPRKDYKSNESSKDTPKYSNEEIQKNSKIPKVSSLIPGQDNSKAITHFSTNNTKDDSERKHPLPEPDFPFEKSKPVNITVNNTEKKHPLPEPDFPFEKSKPVNITGNDTEKEHPLPEPDFPFDKSKPVNITGNDTEKEHPLPEPDFPFDKSTLVNSTLSVSDYPLPTTNSPHKYSPTTPVTDHSSISTGEEENMYLKVIIRNVLMGLFLLVLSGLVIYFFYENGQMNWFRHRHRQILIEDFDGDLDEPRIEMRVRGQEENEQL